MADNLQSNKEIVTNIFMTLINAFISLFCVARVEFEGEINLTIVCVCICECFIVFFF